MESPKLEKRERKRKKNGRARAKIRTEFTSHKFGEATMHRHGYNERADSKTRVNRTNVSPNARCDVTRRVSREMAWKRTVQWPPCPLCPIVRFIAAAVLTRAPPTFLAAASFERDSKKAVKKQRVERRKSESGQGNFENFERGGEFGIKWRILSIRLLFVQSF